MRGPHDASSAISPFGDCKQRFRRARVYERPGQTENVMIQAGRSWCTEYTMVSAGSGRRIDSWTGRPVVLR